MQTLFCVFLTTWFSLSLCGCAAVRVRDVKDLDKKPSGVRVFPPKVYLLVDSKQNRSALAILPDFQRAYDLAPVTVLAKQQFKVDLENGVLSSMTLLQDNTAFLDFFEGSANLGTKAAGLPMASSVLQGTFGLDDGIYVLKDTGSFDKLQKP